MIVKWWCCGQRNSTSHFQWWLQVKCTWIRSLVIFSECKCKIVKNFDRKNNKLNRKSTKADEEEEEEKKEKWLVSQRGNNKTRTDHISKKTLSSRSLANKWTVATQPTLVTQHHFQWNLLWNAIIHGMFTFDSCQLTSFLVRKIWLRLLWVGTSDTESVSNWSHEFGGIIDKVQHFSASLNTNSNNRKIGVILSSDAESHLNKPKIEKTEDKTCIEQYQEIPKMMSHHLTQKCSLLTNANRSALSVVCVCVVLSCVAIVCFVLTWLLLVLLVVVVIFVLLLPFKLLSLLLIGLLSHGSVSFFRIWKEKRKNIGQIVSPLHIDWEVWNSNEIHVHLACKCAMRIAQLHAEFSFIFLQ